MCECARRYSAAKGKAEQSQKQGLVESPSATDVERESGLRSGATVSTTIPKPQLSLEPALALAGC